jgi:hypothetical protein
MSALEKAPPGEARSESWQALSDCLRRVREGSWSFIQLRGASLSDADIDDDDVDLLGTRESVDALVGAAFEWTKQGCCHFRIRARKENKTELTLYSSDGRHRVLFDLWIALPQIERGRQVLEYDDCRQVLVLEEGSIRRLCLEAEACLYVQHLAAKKKHFRSESVQGRLTFYRDACQRDGIERLSDLLSGLRESAAFSEEGDRFTRERLLDLLGRPGRTLRRGKRSSLFRRLGALMIAAPRRLCLLSIMGCDGAGKSTLAERLLEASPRIRRVFTGKHLYRKSLLYKLAVIFIRPLTFQSRERFDELLAPLVYLRASIGLMVKWFRWRGQLTLIDRSLVDFLYLDRKTDAPHFAESQWLIRFFGHRIPTVHCVVSYEKVQERKDEMTRSGHAAYDSDMFRHFSSRRPTDYVCFNNDQILDEAQGALRRIIERF